MGNTTTTAQTPTAGVLGGTQPPVAWAATLAAGLRRMAKGLVWYVRELSGETAYEHYVARHALEHGGTDAPMTATEFWRARGNEEPAPRCC